MSATVRWVPVSERLPPEGVTVLVLWDQDVFEAQLTQLGDAARGGPLTWVADDRDFYYGVDECEVTHWIEGLALPTHEERAAVRKAVRGR